MYLVNKNCFTDMFYHIKKMYIWLDGDVLLI